MYRFALSFIKKIEFLNPGPDRSPVWYAQKLGLQWQIGNINIHKRVATGRALGILAHFRHLDVIKPTLPFREEPVPGPPSGL